MSRRLWSIQLPKSSIGKTNSNHFKSQTGRRVLPAFGGGWRYHKLQSSDFANRSGELPTPSFRERSNQIENNHRAFWNPPAYGFPSLRPSGDQYRKKLRKEWHPHGDRAGIRAMVASRIFSTIGFPLRVQLLDDVELPLPRDISSLPFRGLWRFPSFHAEFVRRRTEYLTSWSFVNPRPSTRGTIPRARSDVTRCKACRFGRSP